MKQYWKREITLFNLKLSQKPKKLRCWVHGQTYAAALRAVLFKWDITSLLVVWWEL
jgi:hypothetical protein